MATFKVMVGTLRADGTRNVKIRIVTRATNTLVSTPMYVTSKQVTRGGVIKDQAIADAADDIVRRWRSIVANLGDEADAMTAKELAELLKQNDRGKEGFRLEWVQHIRDVANSKRGQTAHNYCVVATSFERYSAPHKLDINDITAQVLHNYEAWLRSEDVAPGTITQYMTLLRSAHNAARLKYNDEDAGIVNIRRAPFARYKVPQAPAPVARGVDLATLQAIISLPDEKRVNSTRDLTRDVFALSFALGGMNYADIYNLPYTAYKVAYIEYNRQKTKKARADSALYRVAIADEVRPLVERLLDPKKKRLFGFANRFTEYSFAMTVQRGMRYIEDVVPYERHYTFYAARHTYASLARNVVGLDKYTVHELLNHSDSEMRITDRYIERDWQRLFDAHKKIVKLIKWS